MSLKRLYISIILAIGMLLNASLVCAQTSRPQKTMKTQLQRWFSKTKKQLRKLHQKLPTATKKQQFSLQLKVAKEYEKIIKIHELLIKRYDTYRGTATWRKLARIRGQALQQAKLFRVQAAQIYQRLLSEYPKHPQLCEVYHRLGQHLFSLGKQKLAIFIYKELLKTYAKQSCQYTTHAYLALGEYHFANSQFTSARKMYRKILTFPPDKTTAFARYKLAWCLYNAAHYQDALKQFVGVLNFLKTASPSGLPDNRVALEKKTRRDLILSFAKVGMAKQAQTFFSKVSPLHANRMLLKLTKTYQDQGKYRQAIILLQILQKNTPILQALEYQVQIFSIQRKLLVTFGKQFAAFKTLEKKLKQAQKKHINDLYLFQLEEKISRRLFHWAKSSHREKNYRQADQLYATYAHLFGKTKRGKEILFWRAEVSMKRKRLERAAKQYALFFQLYPRHKFAQDAAYNEVLVLHMLSEKAFKKSAKKKKNHKKEAEKISLHHKSLLLKIKQASFRYFKQKSFPKERTLNIYYALFKLALRCREIAFAETVILQMIQRFPKQKNNQRAAHQVIRYYQQKQRWQSLTGWLKKLSKIPVWKGTKQAKWYDEVWYSIRFQICQKRNQRGKRRAAAKCFLKLTYLTTHQPNQATQALYNSIVIFAKLNTFDDRRQVRHLLHFLKKHYAKTKRGQTLLRQLQPFIPKPSTNPRPTPRPKK